MKSLIIAHAEDPDGIIARALAMRYHTVYSRNQDQHIFIRYDRIVEAFQEAAEKVENYDAVCVADVNLNGRLYAAAGKDLSLLAKLAAGREVLWFDHHDGTQKNAEKLAAIGVKVYYGPNQCAALLMAREFSQNPYDLKLAKIAQAHDYKYTSEDHPHIQIGNDLEKIIALANENLNNDLLLDLSYDLRDGNCLDVNKLLPKWQAYADKFSLREQAAYEELDNTVEIIKAGNHAVLFGYSSPLLSQKLGPNHLRKKYQSQADLFVFLFKPPVRNHLALINKKSSFPVVPFVQSLGGGGHDTGGGFTLDYDITPENYQNVKEMLLSQIEKYSQ